MAVELRPGMFTSLFSVIVVEAKQVTRQALTTGALAVERQAKQNAGGGGSHAYGTPTTSGPGGFPSLISGTLRRSVTHTPVVDIGGGFESRVGPGGGAFPPYPRKGKRTESSKYGLYLETGLRNGATYPWLKPALKTVQPMIPGIFAGFYASAPWPHL